MSDKVGRTREIEISDEEKIRIIKECYKGFLMDLLQEIESNVSIEYLHDLIGFEMSIIKWSKTNLQVDDLILAQMEEMIFILHHFDRNVLKERVESELENSLVFMVTLE